MCTLMMCWYPGSNEPLLVGANRDEDPKRSSTDWVLRHGGIYSPKDVRGGTWIGVNIYGLFAALTNFHCEDPSRGRNSRGHLVMKALGVTNVNQAITVVTDMMSHNIYNAFNLIIADQKRMVAISCSGSSGDFSLKNLTPGQHIINNWGIDNWDLPKSKLVTGTVNADNIKLLLANHGDGTPSGSICVHDKSDHATMSSSVIRIGGQWDWMRIEHIQNPPCSVSPEQWNVFEMEIEK